MQRSDLNNIIILRQFDFEPRLNLRWCRAQDLFRSQILVTTSSFKCKSIALYLVSSPIGLLTL